MSSFSGDYDLAFGPPNPRPHPRSFRTSVVEDGPRSSPVAPDPPIFEIECWCGSHVMRVPFNQRKEALQRGVSCRPACRPVVSRIPVIREARPLARQKTRTTRCPFRRPLCKCNQPVHGYSDGLCWEHSDDPLAHAEREARTPHFWDFA